MTHEPKLVLFDGFDDCILGLSQQFNNEPAVVYDAVKVVATLEARDGMDYDEAWEYFDHNIASSFVDASNPIFVFPFDKELVDPALVHADL